jgi:hypothetical protein
VILGKIATAYGQNSLIKLYISLDSLPLIFNRKWHIIPLFERSMPVSERPPYKI